MCNVIKKIGFGTMFLSLSVLAAALVARSLPAAAQDRPITKPAAPVQPAQQAQKSLYDRVGGVYSIAALVDDYIDNLVKDPTVMANAQVKAAVEKAAAAHGVPGLKYQITALVVEGTGGPYKYYGRDMKQTHKSMGITQAQWDASAVVFKATMDRYKVPAKEQDELFALINRSHDDIVIAK
jgi:hemoglobin